MKEFLINNKKRIIVIALGIIVITTVIFWLASPRLKREIKFWETPKVVSDVFVLPDTKKITASGGREFTQLGQSVALVPKSKGEEVVVTSAFFTIKTGFDSAFIEAKKWSSDAKLVYAKSLGTVDLSGKSSSWQYAFGSKQKKKGYEVIAQGSAIALQKEVEASSYGYDLPKNWYDSGDAILSLQASSPFSNSTMSSILFFYAEKGKIWQYALSTSFGNTLLLVK